MAGGYFVGRVRYDQPKRVIVANIRNLVRPKIDDVAEEVYQDIRRNAPVDTGKLVGSISRNGQTITIKAKHWHYVEYGTQPHIIRPRVKRALWWPDAPHPVGRVFHPGTRAQPFIRPAATRQRILRGVSIDVT